jgi:asparagine synthase (glutamine-hydrolysing)
VTGVDPYATIRDYVTRSDARTILDHLLYADTKTYLHELLMKQDQMSMAASIESRVPFLDHPLMEYAARLPQAMKLRGLTTKYVLRRAMQGVLPEAILTRRKMGFPVPIGRWFAGEYRRVLDEFVLGGRAARRGLFNVEYVRRLVDEHARGEGAHAERLWALVNTEIWQRLFIDGESSADVASAIGLLGGRRPAGRDGQLEPMSSLPLTKSRT